MASLPYIIAAIVGTIVIIHWRRTGQSLWKEMGITGERALPDFGAGVVMGALVMAGVFAVHLLFSLITLIDGEADAASLLTSLPLLLGFALMEEVVFRSLLLNGLIFLLKRKRWAIVLCAVLFGIAHAENPDASALSVISNALGGVMYSLAFLETRRLWLPWGLHFAWNYFQGPVFGFLVSGFNFGGLITHVTTGPTLLTGGGYGPEGGLIGIGFRFVVMALVLWWCRRRS